MTVDYDEFANRVYIRLLRLQAENEVLKGTVLTIFETVKPGTAARVKEEIEKHVEDRLQQLLMHDDYTKDEWDRYLGDIFPVNPD
jgi:hypothetical protein